MILLHVRIITVSKTKISELLLPKSHTSLSVGYVNKPSLANNYFSNVFRENNLLSL